MKQKLKKGKHLKVTTAQLLKALEYAYTRLNEIPHTYQETNFSFIKETIKAAKGL